MSRFRLIALGAAILVVVVVTAAVLFRHGLVGYAIEAALEGRGFSDARVSVTQFGTDGTVIEAIDLGPGAPRVDRIAVSYRLGELLAGNIRSADIEGLALEIDLTEPGVIDRLMALVGEPGEAGTAGGTLPRVSLRDGVVVLAGSAAGPVTVAMNGWLDPEAETDVADAELAITGPQADARIGLTATRGPDGIKLQFQGDGDADLTALPWPANLGPPPRSGTTAFSFDGKIPLAEDGAFDAAALLASDARIAVAIDIAALSLPAVAGRIDGSIAAVLQPKDNTLVVDLTSPATLAAADIDAERLTAVGGPALADLVGDGTLNFQLQNRAADVPLLVWTPNDAGGGQARIALKLVADKGDSGAGLDLIGVVEHDSAYRLNRVTVSNANATGRGLTVGPVERGSFEWQGSASIDDGGQALAGTLRAGVDAVDIGDYRFEALTFEGPIEVKVHDDAIEAAITGPGRLAIGRPPRLGAVRFARPVRVALEATTVVHRGDVTEADIKAQAAISGSIPGDGGESLNFSVATGPVDLSLSAGEQISGRIEVAGAAVDLPDLGIRVDGIRAATPFGGDGPARGNLVAAVSTTAKPALFAPFTVDLKTGLTPSALDATGSIAMKDGRAQAPVKVGYRFDRRRGTLNLGSMDLVFIRGGLQPRHLSPRLSAITNAVGTVTAQATLSFGADRALDGTANVSLGGLFLETPAARIEGLSGTIAFTGLNPPKTEPDTRIRANSIIAGIPLADVVGQFQIDSVNGTPSIRLARAEGRLAGGAITVDDAVIELGGGGGALEVRVKGVSLAELFKEWAVEGLSGTGYLSGTIPLRFGPDGLAIAAGRLDAEQSGMLRVDLGSSREVLARQGEQVALMVQVLENFQYQILELGIDRPTAGDLRLAIHMEGQNPDVLDGYPFRFNINLSGDLEPVLDALRQGEGLSTDLLRDAIRTAN